MGEMISFAANGETFSGYLAPASSPSPGVIVIQEWWGLVGHIKDVADQFATAGYTALAPDFYHGVTTTEPDEAGSLFMALDIANAAKVIESAVTALIANPNTNTEKVAVVGFCMGGQLALFAAGLDPRIAACVNFYGVHPNVQPDYEAMKAPVLGIFAEHDEYSSPDVITELDRTMTANEVAHEFHTYAGCHHAFFNSDRPEVHDAAASQDAWDKTIKFLNKQMR
ncbi:MAG: dienelactone hydrolase family protein [Fimbriimonadaceae bacterium]|nr:MAG: dienelactone hydrolase family protein [Fimbriimonadaceae bacterium]